MAARRRAQSLARERVRRVYDDAQRERLGELQRARILSAMFAVCCERGAGSVSVADVVSRSGISRRTFYEHFTDREECFLAAFESALALASERVLAAYEAQRSWREAIRAALVALLVFLDEQPLLGRVLISESQVGSPRTLERRNEVIAQLTRAVDEGRAVTGASDSSRGAGELSPLVGEGVLSGALAVIQTRLLQEAHEPLIALSNPLMSMIVLPYLGAAAARRELTRPVRAPAPVRQNGALSAEPFKDTPMRITYRTVRVLLAVAEHPGASNRRVGESAGIADQGQISKLLSRLQRIGLLRNTGVHLGKGAANSWELTGEGRRITDGIRSHTQGLVSRGESA